jgi:hypothetical protein
MQCNDQKTKVVGIVFPQAIKDDTAWVGTTASTPASIDTKGFNCLTVYWMLGATDIAQASLIIVEDSASNLGTATALYTFGGTGNLALPTDANDNGIWRVHIPLDGTRKRYIGVTAAAGNGTAGAYAVCWGVLEGANECPNSDTERGVVGSAFV